MSSGNKTILLSNVLFINQNIKKNGIANIFRKKKYICDFDLKCHSTKLKKENWTEKFQIILKQIY
jgi:hypothetical protein